MNLLSSVSKPFGMQRSYRDWTWRFRSQAGASTALEVQYFWACQHRDERPYAQHANNEAGACTDALAPGHDKDTAQGSARSQGETKDCEMDMQTQAWLSLKPAAGFSSHRPCAKALPVQAEILIV